MSRDKKKLNYPGMGVGNGGGGEAELSHKLLLSPHSGYIKLDFA